MNTLNNGRTKVPANKNYFKNKQYFNESLLKVIDTAAVYEEKYSYRSFEKDFTSINNEKSYRTDGWTSIYKFYSNGCVNYFSFKNGYEIEKNDLNPEYNGYRGIYYIDNKGNIKIDEFVIVGYGFTTLYGMDAMKVEIRGDTILTKRLHAPTSIRVYTKKELPKEYFQYKSDW
jgi:hypothetical protein